ncbi:MAG: PD40 domain-containing protein [Anaerolineales bacterium]|nr:PD40 domain-containing protein [Anaerolineales bacterium]
MKPNRMKDALERIARRAVPEDLNLMPSIAARLERKSLMTTLRARPLMAILIALFTLLVLSGVAYAVGRSLGYLPGSGLIEQGAPIRVLREPVSVTRDGITLTVNRAFLTSDGTDIYYFVSGVPHSAYPESEAVIGDCIGEASEPYLLLPDGTKVNEGRFQDTSIPADVNAAVFVMPCIFNTLPGMVPENWELPLQFVPAPPELTVIPVTEMIPSPQATDVLENPLTLTKVLDIGDNLVLIGEFRSDALGAVSQDNVLADGSWWWEKNIRVVDAGGQEIPSTSNPVDIEWPAPTQPNAQVWVYQIRKNFTPPLTIRYEVEHVIPAGAEEQAEFEFDAGPNPQEGDVWALDKDFMLGGFNIRLDSIDLNGGGYNFNFKADPGASANEISVEIAGHPPYCGGGGGGEEFPVEFTRSVCYGGAVPNPNGKLQVILRFQALRREAKNFQLQWSPSEPYAAPTPQPGVCLPLERWSQLTGRNDALPVGVGGKIVTTINEGGPLPAIYVSAPDGANMQKVGVGAWPSLSNAGTQLAYSASDGLRIVNLSNGQSSAIGADGYRIIWSPDDSRMMYTNTVGLYAVNADGSGLQQVNVPPAQVIAPVGWLDNQSIVYGVLGGDGFMLKTYNLQSGEPKDLFTIHNKAGYGAISPDGQWILFADREFGETNWGIFISRLDGSERTLIVEPDVSTAFMSSWGPDGQWLIVNTRNANDKNIPVLINPFTCEAFALNQINGTVEGWSR